MPAPVKIRVSFQQDRAYLRRLQQAIERDPSRDVKWKRQITAEIDDVLVSMERADTDKAEKDKAARKAKEAARQKPDGKEKTT